MIIDGINLNHLRIFECVYRTASMTTAARELHLTQSGVSQHMKALEEALGLQLFDRVKQRLVPTAAAGALFKSCVDGLSGIESTVASLRGDGAAVAGNVVIGMPIEFGNNIVLPLLSEFCRKHPRIKFALRYGFANEMNVGLLSGAIDFAFVDEFMLDKRIRIEPVYDETIHLCASRDFLKDRGIVKNTRDWFEGLDYVDYQEGAPVLRMWFKHHLKSRELKLNVRGTVVDVQGVARLILTGLAAGVLPGHLVTTLEEQGSKLYVFKGCGKPLKNAISMASLSERTHSPAAKATLEFLLKGTRGGR